MAGPPPNQASLANQLPGPSSWQCPQLPHIDDALAQRALNSLEDRLLAVAAAWAPGETVIQAYAAWLEDCIDYLATVFRTPPYSNLGAHLAPDLRRPHRGRTMVEMCMRI